MATGQEQRPPTRPGPRPFPSPIQAAWRLRPPYCNTRVYYEKNVLGGAQTGGTRGGSSASSKYRHFNRGTFVGSEWSWRNGSNCSSSPGRRCSHGYSVNDDGHVICSGTCSLFSGAEESGHTATVSSYRNSGDCAAAVHVGSTNSRCTQECYGGSIASKRRDRRDRTRSACTCSNATRGGGS